MAVGQGRPKWVACMSSKAKLLSHPSHAHYDTHTGNLRRPSKILPTQHLVKDLIGKRHEVGLTNEYRLAALMDTCFVRSES